MPCNARPGVRFVRCASCVKVCGSAGSLRKGRAFPPATGAWLSARVVEVEFCRFPGDLLAGLSGEEQGMCGLPVFLRAGHQSLQAVRLLPCETLACILPLSGKAVALMKIRIHFEDDLPDCEGCGEKFCPACNAHYADCSCPGPMNAEEQGYRLEEDAEGILWAVKPSRRYTCEVCGAKGRKNKANRGTPPICPRCVGKY